MCRRATCQSCNKPTYSGCGAHVEQVLGDVPLTARCRCREKTTESKPQARSWISDLFGKGGK